MEDAISFKERLYERIEEYFENVGLDGGYRPDEKDEMIGGLVSEVYDFLTDRDEGEEMIFPVPTEGEEDDPDGEER